jgi:signal transduction histidine kinase
MIRTLSRLIPDRLATRMAATVVLALLLTQAVSALLYLTDHGEGRPMHSPPELRARIVAIVQLVEGTPAEQRRRVVRALDDPFLGVEWRRERPELMPAPGTPRLQHLRHHLEMALGGPEREILAEVRNDPQFTPATGPFAEGHPGPRYTALKLGLALTDGSWLVFTVTNAPDGSFRLLRYGLWMVAIVAVIAGLSLWAARRLAAPLAAFARAAEGLAVDGAVAPLPETGPRELRAATRAVNRMQERLSRYVEDRTRMLAAISHDLRTPLTRLRLRAEFVDDPDQQKKMLADIEEMAAMLTATLAFARDDAQHEPRVAVDLADLLQSLCDDRVDAGHEAGYQGPAHLTWVCRPVALRRAFANLLDNAINYGGAAEVRLAAGGGHLTVEIADRGPGIPEAAREKVFQPFFRLETSRSRDTGGTGLGLAVARTILRGHGGDIALTGRAGGGLVAVVTLPQGPA